MSTDTESSLQLDGDMVLVPAANIVEMPIADEVIVWRPDRAVPLQLNAVATTIWWHFEAATLDEVARDVAQHYQQPIGQVRPGVHFVTRSLYEAGLLRTQEDNEPEVPATTPALADHEPTAKLSRAATAWLERRAVHRVPLRVGHLRFGVAANTAQLGDRLSALLDSRLAGDGDPAPVRYLLVDAGHTGAGCRYWLLSDTGLPLERTDSLDDLVHRLDLHLAEVAAVQQPRGVPLRLGVLEASDHVVAVQWDLLSSRPTLEPSLGRLGYRIRSGQWAVVDPTDLSVHPGATATGEVSGTALPLAAIVGWFGPGSLDAPNTQAEWAWTLAMFGSVSNDLPHVDRPALLETAVALVNTCRLDCLSDAGPTALLNVLADISRSRSHE